jgi:MYND finger
MRRQDKRASCVVVDHQLRVSGLTIPCRMANRYRESIEQQKDASDTEGQDVGDLGSTQLSKHKQCTICGELTLKHCLSCLAAPYCSQNCQKRDWPLHRALCKRIRLFPPRPASEYRLALFFPVERKRPELKWIKCTQNIDDDDGEVWESPDCSLLGDDKPSRGSLTMTKNTRRGISLDHTIKIYIRDNFLADGSKPNKSILECTRGAVSHNWSGPCIAMRQPNTNVDPLVYVDITLADFRTVVDYFSAYADDSVEGIESPVESEDDSVAGVKVNCAADRRVFGTPEYSPVAVPPDHRIFYAPRQPPISKLLGIPLLVLNYPPDQAWKDDDDIPGDEDAYQNVPITFLFITVDPSDRWWGWAPPKWQQDIGSVIIVREDRKTLTPLQVEAICFYCQRVAAPLFADALGMDGDQRSQEEVMGYLTKQNFAEFFQEYRAAGLKRDPLWAQEKSPYEE